MTKPTEPKDSLENIFAAYKKVFDDVLALNPLGDGYASISVSAAGWECPNCFEMHVFYGAGCVFDVSSMAELAEKVKQFDPAQVKAAKIAKLKEELAELEGETV